MTAGCIHIRCAVANYMSEHPELSAYLDIAVGILHNLSLTFCITKTLCVVGLYGGSRRRGLLIAPLLAEVALLGIVCVDGMTD